MEEESVLVLEKVVSTKAKLVMQPRGSLFVTNRDFKLLTSKIPKNLRQKIRISCEAQFRIKFDKYSRKYVVDTYNEYHNHALILLECAHMLSSQRKISAT